MAANGRPCRSTADERAEVRRLALLGVSVREIAERVFGERRFRGRVERILKTVEPVAVVGVAEDRRRAVEEFMVLPRVEQFRRLLDRRMAELAGRDDAASPRELLGLLNLDRQIRALETLERLRAF